MNRKPFEKATKDLKMAIAPKPWPPPEKERGGPEETPREISNTGLNLNMTGGDARNASGSAAGTTAYRGSVNTAENSYRDEPSGVGIDLTQQGSAHTSRTRRHGVSFLRNEQELEQLYGLPHRARVVYDVLRERMDFSTGLVGAVHRISWLGIADRIYVEPAQGRPEQTFTISQVKWAVRQLEQAGLVESRSNEAEKQLILFLPKATRDSLVQEKYAAGVPQAHVRTRIPGSVSGNRRRHNTGAGTPADARPATSPVSDLPKNHYHKAKDTSAPEAHEGGGRGELIFPSKLEPAERAAALKTLQDLPIEDAQALLDELQGAFGEVNRPLGYLRGLIRRYRDGDFTPEKGIQVRSGRERLARIEEAAKHRDEPVPVNVKSGYPGLVALFAAAKGKREATSDSASSPPLHDTLAPDDSVRGENADEDGPEVG